MFHRHNWNLIRTDRIEGVSIYPLKTYSTEDTELALAAMRDQIVHVFKCDCGKVKVVKR